MTKVLFLMASLFGAAAFAEPCVDHSGSAFVEVDAATSRMYLCARGTAEKEYVVALGRGGLDKKLFGDGKTPLGEYALGRPYRSQLFAMFIPVAYPTEAQKANGYTGNDIGIHGPSLKIVKWLESAGVGSQYTTLVNWTNGCIAVGTVAEIEEISQWVLRMKARKVLIH